MKKIIQLTDRVLREMIKKEISKMLSESREYSQAVSEYVPILEHDIMDTVHDNGQKASSAVRGFILPQLKEGMETGRLNSNNCDMNKLNILIQALEKYSDTVDNAYNKVYYAASDVLYSLK